MKTLVRIPVEVFRSSVTVVHTKEEFLAVANDWGTDETELCTDVAGLCLHDPENGVLVGVFEGGTGTLVHELTHACIFILNRVGIDPRDSYGEVLAYLMDHLFSKVTSAVPKKTKQSRSKTKHSR